MSAPGKITEKQRAILFDAPLAREQHSSVWIGRRGRHNGEAVTRLIDRRLLSHDLEKCRFARAADVTDAGRQALLSA
jgi:hypothetical protein